MRAPSLDSERIIAVGRLGGASRALESVVVVAESSVEEEEPVAFVTAALDDREACRLASAAAAFCLFDSTSAFAAAASWMAAKDGHQWGLCTKRGSQVCRRRVGIVDGWGQVATR